MRKENIEWESLTEGQGIPVLIKEPTPMHLFMFSAATWNRHLIHYNAEYARKDGLPDVAVHRALIGNYLAQVMSDWVSEKGRVTRVEWNVRVTAVPGDRLSCKGKVFKKWKDENKKMVSFDIWVEKDDGQVVAPGKGEVEIY